MPTSPPQSENDAQKLTVHVTVLASDGAGGTVPDNTTPIAPITSASGVASVIVDPGNPRAVIITGQNPGNANITVQCATALAPLVIPVTVTAAPPNLSRVDFVSADPPVPK